MGKACFLSSTFPDLWWPTFSHIHTPTQINNMGNKKAPVTKFVVEEEKIVINIFPEEDKLLNKRPELISKCGYKHKFLLRYLQ